MAHRAFLRIDREGENLRVRLDPMLYIDPAPVFQLVSNRGCVIDAELAAVRLAETFRALVQEARAKAYADGYRDGRAKRAKAPPQWGWLGKDMP